MKDRSRKPTHAGDAPLPARIVHLCRALFQDFQHVECPPSDIWFCMITSPHALSCSATNDEGLRRVTERILNSLSSSIPAASANETSARSSVKWIPSLRACRSQVLLNSSTQRPVNLPSTLSLTP